MRSGIVAILLLGLLGGVALVVVGGGPTGPDRLLNPSLETEAAFGADAASPRSPAADADAQLLAGNLGSAREAYIEAIASDPDDVDARLQLTLVSLLQGDLTEARTQADEIARLRPGGSEAAVARAALAVAEEGAAADPATIAAARDALDERPGLLIARWAVAQSILEGENPCGAVSVLDAGIALAPEFYPLHEMRLNAFSRAGDRLGGVAQLERMHRRFPDRPDIGQWLLEAYEASGDAAAVAGILRERVREAKAVAPDDPAAALRLVDHVSRTEGQAAARSELERLVAENAGTPLGARLQLDLARVESETGDAAAAMRRLEALPALAGAGPSLANDATAELARLLDSQGETDRARAAVATVLQADPTHVEALKLQAAGLLADGDPRGALTALQAAGGQDRRDTSILLLMAEAYRRDGATALAGDTFARAVEISEGGAAESRAFAAFLTEGGHDRAAAAILAEIRSPEAPAVATAIPPPDPDAAPPSAGRRCEG